MKLDLIRKQRQEAQESDKDAMSSTLIVEGKLMSFEIEELKLRLREREVEVRPRSTPFEQTREQLEWVPDCTAAPTDFYFGLSSVSRSEILTQNSTMFYMSRGMVPPKNRTETRPVSPRGRGSAYAMLQLDILPRKIKTFEKRSSRRIVKRHRRIYDFVIISAFPHHPARGS